MFFVGIMQAIGLSLCLSFLNVFLRVAVHQWHVQPIIFTCVCLMTAALVLSLAGGPGRLTKATLKSPATWVYSVLLMSAYVTDVYIMQYLSATEASFYSRLTIPLALLSAWYLHRRAPQRSDMAGLSLVCVALIWLTALQPAALLTMIMVLVILGAFIQTALVVIAETHKESVAAAETGTIRDRARVVGFVTFISSTTFLIATLILCILFALMGWSTSQSYGLVPELKSFIHPPTVAAAIFYGILILPLIRYLKWGASYNLKAENLLVVMSFIPVLTLLMEYMVGFMIEVPANNAIFEGVRGKQLIIIALLITLGAGLTTFLRIRQKVQALPAGENAWSAFKKAMASSKKTHAIHHSATAMDDYEIIVATLEYAGGDESKAAKLLGIPRSTLVVILEGKGELALVEGESQKLARQYRANVTSRDALTGLLNRAHFAASVKERLRADKPVTLLYIDLNKFKPINDTYGHEVGDAVLKEMAQRFLNTAPSQAFVARLGGDEFAIALRGGAKEVAEALQKQLKACAEEPIALPSIEKPLQLGASIGLAYAPDDAGTFKALLAHADKAMYAEKREKTKL